MTRFLPKLLLLTLVRVALPAAADPGHLPVWVPLGPGTPGDRAPWELQLHRLPGGVARVELTLPGFHRVSSDRGDSRFEAVVLAGTGTTRVPGLPALPVIQERIPAAAGAGPLVLDVAVETVRVPGIVPLPFTPRPTRCGGDWPARESCDAAWYAGGEPFPATWATAREAGILRGVPVVEVTFSPFRYHPGTRDLEVARRVVMTLALPPLDPASLPPRAFSRPFADEVKRSFLDPLPLMREGPSGAAERLLVLAHDDLAPALEELLAWKRTTGLDTELVLLSSVGTTWQAVAGFLADQYFNAEVAPTYVLLAGDGEGPATVPWVPSPLGCASDFLYSTLDGDDLYAELLVGRFSADTADQAALQAAKVIAYERDLLPEIAAWVPRSACLSSSEGNGGSNDDVRSDIICGVQQDADFETLKLYHSLGNDTASNVTAALNQGLGWVTYLGHGSGTSWATTTPEYTVSHVHALANGGRTPFIMDVSCSNGAFEQPGGDCLAEAWLRTGGPGDLRGGIGSWSASTPAAWDEPAEMAVGFTRGILEQGIHRYGEACLYARGYMLETLPGYGSLEEVCHQYVLFGDPSLRLRTRVPWVPEVQLPALVPVGLPSMEVAVSRGGEPVAGASVVVRKEGDVYTAAFTGPDGVAHPAVAASSPGALEVWVTAADATAWHGTVTVAATGCGILLAGTAVAACEAAVPLTLYDQDLNQHPGQEETASVTATAPGAAPVAIVLTEAGPDSSKFTGSLVLSAAGIPGSLVATHGEGVTVTYGDADCEGAATEDVVALAVDCLPPEIGGVSVQGIGPGSATVVFSTDEAAVGLVRIGVAPPPGQEHPGPAGVTSHAIPVAGLVPSTTYFVEVQATDPAGNSATDDAGGAFYVFETPACTPLCEGLQCGANGCGGVCGTCCPDQACVNGLCSGGAGCVPAGSAGCGGCPCEACVCDMDPYCCNGHWDDICASECQVQCGGCPNQGDCTGRECGDDGCGGSCGDCPGDLACVQGLCGEPCVPSCAGKECGDDGCGGSCGGCP
ncbi:MAG: hypothetical protein FJ098_05655, partial [Deltaproteobacteria bacterium]|nr:hypothetical protein [Deltaproteobacteria bacterium]